MRNAHLAVAVASIALLTACDQAQAPTGTKHQEPHLSAQAGATVDQSAAPTTEAPSAATWSAAVRPITSATGSPQLVRQRINFKYRWQWAYVNSFENFGTDFSYPGDPWTARGVTYTSANNIIVGTGTAYAPRSTVICNNFWTPITGSIAGGFDMFGFDLGVLGVSSAADLTVTTNLNSYSYQIERYPNWANGNIFVGLIAANPGEWFTGFSIASTYGPGSAPCLDEVTVGVKK
jgi:hypothetical protein